MKTRVRFDQVRRHRARAVPVFVLAMAMLLITTSAPSPVLGDANEGSVGSASGLTTVTSTVTAGPGDSLLVDGGFEAQGVALGVPVGSVGPGGEPWGYGWGSPSSPCSWTGNPGVPGGAWTGGGVDRTEDFCTGWKWARSGAFFGLVKDRQTLTQTFTATADGIGTLNWFDANRSSWRGDTWFGRPNPYSVTLTDSAGTVQTIGNYTSQVYLGLESNSWINAGDDRFSLAGKQGWFTRSATGFRLEAGTTYTLSFNSLAPTYIDGGGVERIDDRTTLLDDISLTSQPCVDTAGIIGWWPGEGALTAQVGPDASGAATYGTGRAGQGFAIEPSAPLSAVGVAQPSTALTLDLWIKPQTTAAGVVQTLVSRWSGVGFTSATDDGHAYNLELHPNNDLVFETDDLSTRSPEQLRFNAPQLVDGNFHHVAATWTPATMTLYVDGVQVATKASQGGELQTGAPTPVRLGGPFGYTGVIDEPTIWNRALSSSEIATIAAYTVAKCP
jgi:hypothetical protein